MVTFGTIMAWLGILMGGFFVIAGLGMSEHLVLTLVEQGDSLTKAINGFVFFIVFFLSMFILAVILLMQKKLPTGYTQDEYNFCKDNNIPIR